MKFGLFHQLPCATTQDAATRYQETIEQIVYAEELGFDTAWLAELHFNPRFSIMPAPLLVAAALAQRTSRRRLGTMVLLLPLQHPLRTAEEAVVDLLSQGRLELGIGRGMIAIHFQGFNILREESRERFEEALTIITQAWTQETVQFNGKYFQMPVTAVVPKPVQKPHPPLRIAANSPETATFAGEQGYPVFIASPINIGGKLAEQVGCYRQAFCSAGHDRSKEDVAIAFPVYIANDAVQVRHEVEASFLNYFQAISYQAQLGAREDSPVYAYLHDIRKRAEAVRWEDIETMALCGAPATCIRKIAEVHAQCRMHHLICWFNPGGLMPHRDIMTSMRRFAAEVMPAVRGLEGNTQ
jgi:alkanesulfonate monooxygenase SsuD/methylene tetrahydromethanopterin reductase-like flavin-dependent oxidoreductase (luciferase family)